jgi:hypothetical protein
MGQNLFSRVEVAGEKLERRTASSEERMKILVLFKNKTKVLAEVSKDLSQ